MKNLSNEEIIFLIKKCKVEDCLEAKCANICPIWKECLHFFTGEDVGSCLEKEKK